MENEIDHKVDIICVIIRSLSYFSQLISIGSIAIHFQNFIA